jgi:hypothetical protein
MKRTSSSIFYVQGRIGLNVILRFIIIYSLFAHLYSLLVLQRPHPTEMKNKEGPMNSGALFLDVFFVS